MKILIIGKNGQLGRSIQKVVSSKQLNDEYIFTSRHNLDLESLDNISKYFNNNENEKILLIQNKALELSLFLSIPATIALLIASEQIISALFGYGSFDEISVQNSSKALFYFALGLPAFSLIKVFSSFYFARHNTKLPFYISLISVLLNMKFPGLGLINMFIGIPETFKDSFINSIEGVNPPTL